MPCPYEWPRPSYSSLKCQIILLFVLFGSPCIILYLFLRSQFSKEGLIQPCNLSVIIGFESDSLPSKYILDYYPNIIDFTIKQMTLHKSSKLTIAMIYQILANFKMFLLNLLCLTHLFPMYPFSNPWKHQKTVKFSHVFRV